MKHATWFLVLALASCAHQRARFPLRDPLAFDTDMTPVSLPCHPDPSKKEPHRVACTPAEYVSPFIWNVVEETLFQPLSDVFSIDVSGEALNANSLDEVADSAWFQGRIDAPWMTPEKMSKGACGPEDALPTDVPDGAWVIDQGKGNGSTPGFRVTVPGKGLYLLKADEKDGPERASAASVIGAAIYNAVGFNTSCEQIIYIRPEQLKLTPGLVTVSNSGISRPFDEAALTKLLADSAHRGNLIRLQASKWLPGNPLGPFRYRGTRDDDPNDVLPHQHRRELRGSRLLAAWLNHWDAREQNSMDMWISSDPKDKRASPGYVRHYVIDTSDIFGQRVTPKTLEARLGFSYEIDFKDVFVDMVTLGLVDRPWNHAEYTPGQEIFGYFSERAFDPDHWKTHYPNPAFVRATERDNAWMARLIARISPEDLRALIRAGDFTNVENADYLYKVLLARQWKILTRYLTVLSPITDVRRQPDGKLCGLDLARLRGLFRPDQFKYQVTELAGDQHLELAAEVRPDGVVCFQPRSIAPAGLPDDAPARAVIFRVDSGVADPLEIHAYDLGPSRGMRVVGLRRD